jgi:hypothetical protein
MNTWQRTTTDKLATLKSVTQIVAKADGTIEFRVSRGFDEKLTRVIERISTFTADFGYIYQHSGVWARPPHQLYVDIFLRPNPATIQDSN